MENRCQGCASWDSQPTLEEGGDSGLYLVNIALGDTVHCKIEQDQGDQVELVNPCLILASDGSPVNLIENCIDSLCDLLTGSYFILVLIGWHQWFDPKLGGGRCYG